MQFSLEPINETNIFFGLFPAGLASHLLPSIQPTNQPTKLLLSGLGSLHVLFLHQSSSNFRILLLINLLLLLFLFPQNAWRSHEWSSPSWLGQRQPWASLTYVRNAALCFDVEQNNWAGITSRWRQTDSIVNYWVFCLKWWQIASVLPNSFSAAWQQVPNLAKSQ